MLKRLIRYISHKIYLLGYYEALRIKNDKKREYLNSVATVDSTAFLSDESEIHNNSRSRDCIKIGKRTRLMCQLFLFDEDGSISIGDDCFVGPDTRIWSSKEITIGDRVLIAHNVNINDNISHPLDAKERYEEHRDFVLTGKHRAVDLRANAIVIEDDVWIGFNSIILKGVTIGRGAIIGAGSVVTKDVEPWTINVGNPLRCVEKLDPLKF